MAKSLRKLEWGEIAYRGYYNKSKGQSLISGAPLPDWNEQDPKIKDAWEAAAQAVLEIVENDNGPN